MVKVYDLSVDLNNDPERVRLAQALTLDADRPSLGLKGSFGLFGSPEWWENVRTGAILTERLIGVIRRVYAAGQDPSDIPNSFDMVTPDGETHSESIYVNARQDVGKFQLGSTVEVLYALDELKSPRRDGTKYSKIVLEMSVST